VYIDDIRFLYDPKNPFVVGMENYNGTGLPGIVKVGATASQTIGRDVSLRSVPEGISVRNCDIAHPADVSLYAVNGFRIAHAGIRPGASAIMRAKTKGAFVACIGMMDRSFSAKLGRL
jgi:hypothetical protein